MAIFKSPDEVPLFKYGMIMADPPWLFKNWSVAGEVKNASAQYQCTGLDWIKSIRVGDMAGPDCVLWLWATNPMLKDAFDVMDAWGFKFKTAGHWSKKTVHGKQAFGTGYILRSAGEPFLIGTIGKPKTSRSVRSVIEGPVREHSRKPDEAFSAAETLCGDVPRLELFAREERTGWDVMGDEVGRFNNSEMESSE
jgi:N6-adenosine-specific RNA methylase IME4